MTFMAMCEAWPLMLIESSDPNRDPFLESGVLEKDELVEKLAPVFTSWVATACTF